ncbi:hypothetical protein BACCAP_02272 [Pseudoflavonifractor capillosus ATCC 29799]|uniref:Uncharacterized protein n=1 Tax=Pseudoflavonifractor capillosus ATCC 29799 TaxID=411467 RepID=A6NVM9_9FIRM|nr:hypothetical protein BACCAP_02272 [Pseudoflavonifractor capillosus ATCC 29799]
MEPRLRYICGSSGRPPPLGEMDGAALRTTLELVYCLTPGICQ